MLQVGSGGKGAISRAFDSRVTSECTGRAWHRFSKSSDLVTGFQQPLTPRE